MVKKGLQTSPSLFLPEPRRGKGKQKKMETTTTRPALGPWVPGCIRKSFGLSQRASARLADFLGGSELYPDVLAELMMSARTRLARRAIQIESEPVDREGGFKRVWYDESEDRVLTITRACKLSDARQALLEVVVQAGLAEHGVAVPRILATNVRLAGTPVCQLFQVTTVAERMHCTLADRLASSAFAGLPDTARTNEIVMMISSMCRCVHKMHRHIGFMHGDLKPDNIMLRVEPTGQADIRDWYVIDFGLSKNGSCSDLFFLCWWLANPYAKYMTPVVLESLRAALRVPRAALAAAKCASTLGPGETMDFAACIPRQKGHKAKSAQDESWVSKYGITKSELYDIQRTIATPCYDPRAFYAKFVRHLYVAR